MAVRKTADQTGLLCTIERYGFTAIVRVAGPLNLTTAPTLRTVFLKCLADEPDRVILDLTGMTITEEVAASVMRSLVNHAAAWPGCPVAVSAPPAVATVLDRMALHRDLTRYSSTAEAVDDPSPSTAPLRLRAWLEATLEAPAAARILVAHACRAWDLGDIADVAELIITELSTNAIRHARTEMEVRLNLSRRYLHLAIRDRNPAPPRLGTDDGSMREEGRGLLVIEALAAAWGYTPTVDGKVVWATLSTVPRGVR